MKTKIIYTLISILISQQTSIQELEGCKKVSNFKCQVCDNYYEYFLQEKDGICKAKDPIDNCVIRSSEGKCDYCLEGFNLNTSTQKCDELQSQQKNSNCFIYINGSCVYCVDGFYLNGVECVAVTNKINNCVNYDENQRCTYCANGYAKDSIRNECVKPQQLVENCSAYNFYECKKCKSNYIINNSLYSDNLSKPGNAALLADEDFRILLGSSTAANFQVCEQIVLANCKVIQDYKSCKECESGYFLNYQGLCERIPDQKIANCSDYFNLTKCLECKDGFHLTESSLCEENEEVSHCINYDSTQKETTCLECEQEYYRENITSCQQRQNLNIQNCSKRDFFKDECETCNDDYSLTNDGKKCLPSIDNCKLYEENEESATAMKCKQCNPGYYVTQEFTCTQGSHVNCDKYLYQEDKCEICSEKYYLDGVNCKQHTNIPQCENYDRTQLPVNSSQICLQCSKDYVYFSFEQICKIQDQALEGCKKYLSETECKECNAGYFLQTSNQTCQKITTVNDCDYLEDTQSNSCKQCKAQYMMYKDSNSHNKCILPNDYLERFCHANNLDLGKQTQESAKCEICEQGAVPVNQKNNYVCLRFDYPKFDQSFLVQNCNQLDEDPSTTQGFKCTSCKSNYFLMRKEDILEGGVLKKACEETCNSGEFVMQDIVLTQTMEGDRYIYEITQNKVCQTSNVNIIDKFQYCKVAAPLVRIANFSQTLEKNEVNSNKNLPESERVNKYRLNQTCVQCIDSTIQVIAHFFKEVHGATLGKIFHEVNTISFSKDFLENDESKKLKVNSPVSFYPEIIKCVKLDSSNEQQAMKVDNCEYYVEIQNGNEVFYRCIRCKLKYKGLLSASNNYITSCVDFEECKYIQYEGLPTALNALISCHSCEEGIPILVGNFGGLDFKGFKEFKAYDSSKKVTKWTQDISIDSGYTNLCEKYSENEMLKVKQVKLPPKCAIAYRNLHLVSNIESQILYADNSYGTTSIDIKRINIGCLACEPGYKQVTSQIPYLVTDCEQIPQCKSSSWFNYCSKCQDNSVYEVKEENSIQSVDYSKCTRFDENLQCQAVKIVNDQKECFICLPGYNLNADNFCEKLEPENCKEYNNKSKFLYGEANTYLYDYPNGIGCVECDDNKIAVKFLTNTMSCFKSTYINGLSFKENTSYINNCLHYFLDFTNGTEIYKCHKCHGNYILSEDQKNCILSDVLDNCSLAKSQTECVECEENFVLVQNKCESQKILYCKIYVQDSNQQEQKCLQCNSGFYLLTQKQCQKGQINKCDEYFDNPKKCKKCQENYFVVKAKNEDYCFQIDSRINCTDLDEEKFQNQKIFCNSCPENQNLYLKTLTVQKEKDHCSSFEKIANCKIYDNQHTISGSTFECLECEDEFYTTGFECVQRQVNTLYCRQYEKDQDLCADCNKGYYIDENRKCLETPKGIAFCEDYQKVGTCSLCQKNYYLKENQCIAVQNTQLIEKCEYYVDQNTCSSCQLGYVVNDQSGQCIQSQATGCKVYKSVKECGECNEGFGFRQDQDLINCVQKPDSKCVISEDTGDFQCLQCAKNHFPNNNNVCTQSSFVIPNCLANQSEEFCLICEPGYVLSSDQKSCNAGLHYDQYKDENCLDSQIKFHPICTVCKMGYFLNEERKCVKGEVEGCYLMDSHDPTKCLLCLDGYQMRENSADDKITCVKNTKIKNQSTTVTDNTDNDNNNVQEVDTKKLVLLKVLIALIVVV